MRWILHVVAIASAAGTFAALESDIRAGLMSPFVGLFWIAASVIAAYCVLIVAAVCVAACGSRSLALSDLLSCAIATGAARRAVQRSCPGWGRYARISGFFRAKSSFGGTRPRSATGPLLIGHPFVVDADRRYPIKSRRPHGLRCRPEYSTTIRAFDPRDTSWWRRNRRGSPSAMRCLNSIDKPSTPSEVVCRRQIARPQ